MLPDGGTRPVSSVARMTKFPTTSPPLTIALASCVLAVTLIGIPIAALADTIDDTDAPEVTFNLPTTPASGWHSTASVPVRLTASDAGSGVTSISYVIGDSAPVTVAGADATLAVAAEGVTPLTAWATDAAGNDSPTKTHIFRIDRSAPEIAVATPTLVERGAALTFELACSDDGSGVAACTSDVAHGASLPTDELGEHTVEITARDVAGFESAFTFRYLVAPDLTRPTVGLAVAPEPASGWYTSVIGVGIVASDASGIASRHWWTDGAVSTNGDVTGEEAEAVFTLDFEGITDVSYWAYDRHGNRGEGSHRLRVDTVAPTVGIGDELPPLAASTPEYRVGERVVIRAVCEDATSGIDACGIAESPDGVVPTDSAGEHLLTLVGTDIAGNRTEVEYRYLVVAPAPGGGAGGDGGDVGGGDSDADAPARPASADPRPRILASTGVDLAGIVMIAGLLVGAGLGAVGGRRMLRH